MKRLLFLALTGALLATAVPDIAYAGDRDKGSKHRRDSRYEHRNGHDDRRHHDKHDHDRRHVHYLGSRDVVVIREYYRPYYRPLPRGVQHVYYRDGYLPPGWAKRIRPVPVHVVHGAPLPHGYSRGIIDGHVVVHNNHGLILDVAVLF